MVIKIQRIHSVGLTTDYCSREHAPWFTQNTCLQNLSLLEFQSKDKRGDLNLSWMLVTVCVTVYQAVNRVPVQPASP